jgi:hypothetical protein
MTTEPAATWPPGTVSLDGGWLWDGTRWCPHQPPGQTVPPAIPDFSNVSPSAPMASQTTLPRPGSLAPAMASTKRMPSPRVLASGGGVLALATALGLFLVLSGGTSGKHAKNASPAGAHPATAAKTTAAPARAHGALINCVMGGGVLEATGDNGSVVGAEAVTDKVAGTNCTYNFNFPVKASTTYHFTMNGQSQPEDTAYMASDLSGSLMVLFMAP